MKWFRITLEESTHPAEPWQEVAQMKINDQRLSALIGEQAEQIMAKILDGIIGQ